MSEEITKETLYNELSLYLNDCAEFFMPLKLKQFATIERINKFIELEKTNYPVYAGPETGWKPQPGPSKVDRIITIIEDNPTPDDNGNQISHSEMVGMAMEHGKSWYSEQGDDLAAIFDELTEEFESWLLEIRDKDYQEKEDVLEEYLLNLHSEEEEPIEYYI